MRKVAVIASASASGKTTLGRELARRLDVPFVDLDSIAHGPNWSAVPVEEMCARLEPVLAGEGWVVDGQYFTKIGTVVIDSADSVVWLDLPMRVWLPRLLRRTIRRIVTKEVLWNGNRETFRTAFLRRDSVIYHALRNFRARRRRYPVRLARHDVVRLRSQREVDEFLAGVA